MGDESSLGQTIHRHPQAFVSDSLSEYQPNGEATHEYKVSSCSSFEQRRLSVFWGLGLFFEAVRATPFMAVNRHISEGLILSR